MTILNLYPIAASIVGIALFIQRQPIAVLLAYWGAALSAQALVLLFFLNKPFKGFVNSTALKICSRFPFNALGKCRLGSGDKNKKVPDNLSVKNDSGFYFADGVDKNIAGNYSPGNFKVILEDYFQFRSGAFNNAFRFFAPKNTKPVNKG
jgi:hypothetical protein